MKRKRFTEEQIIAVLKEHEAGAKTADLARKHGISEATFYNWKAKFGGMDVSEANSDCEIVVGQAVKNLRYLDRSHIHEKLSANKDSKIATAVWRNGVRQPDRREILQVLRDAGANMIKTACIFQPNARMSEVDAIRAMSGGRNASDTRRLQQLDALLLAPPASGRRSRRYEKRLR